VFYSKIAHVCASIPHPNPPKTGRVVTGAKLTRPEVYAITEAMHRALDADEAVIPTAVRESPIPEVPAEWG